MKPANDEAIEQIRETRHRISAPHEHEAEKLVNYYIELEKSISAIPKTLKARNRVSKQATPNKSLQARREQGL